MKIKGIQKLTLLDYPGKVATTVFLGGCNFRCPFCHNASLVLPEREGATLSEDGFFGFLEARRGKLQAVCISGGEPTLYPELPTFIKKIRALGYLVKLDTNGYRPDVLEALISEGLLDYVAMDIKNSKAKYGKTVGIANFDIAPIEKSIEILRRGSVDYEFRTTVVRELHTHGDIMAIGEWLRGGEKFFLQPFKDSGDVLQGGLSAYSEAEMRVLLDIFRSFVSLAQIRG